MEKNGNPIFEICKNEPQDNPISKVSKNKTGIITVTDKNSGNFIYKIRPASETSVTFGRLDGTEDVVIIGDRNIIVGTNTIENNKFIGNMAGVVVYRNGSIGIGTPIPSIVLKWLGVS